MSNNISKKPIIKIEETEETETVNWPVVLPLLLVMVATFVAAFIALI